MNLAIILVVVAAVALIVILRVTLPQGLQLFGERPGTEQIQPVDLDAFRNLAGPAEDDYLRRRLPPGEFRAVQRMRLRAMAAYVHAASRNAAIMVRMGQYALASSDARTVEAAQQLVENALLLRRNAMLITVRIYASLLWPQSGLGAAPVLRGYERLNGAAMLLGRLQNPASPVRISATW